MALKPIPPPQTVLARIQPLADLDGFADAERFLKAPDLQYYVGGGSNVVPASAVVHAWGTRLFIARARGRAPTVGCEHLVSSATILPPETSLEYLIFERPSGVACFWFLKTTGEPIGFVVGEMSAGESVAPGG